VWRDSRGKGFASSSTASEEEHRSMNVFNRNVKRLQRDRAAADPESHDYDYLRKEIALRLTDRLQVCDTHTLITHAPLTRTRKEGSADGGGTVCRTLWTESSRRCWPWAALPRAWPSICRRSPVSSGLCSSTPRVRTRSPCTY
jgi:hypothetical protein